LEKVSYPMPEWQAASGKGGRAGEGRNGEKPGGR